MAKRGRPAFESDGLKEFMMKAIKNMCPSDCKRTLQNKYYESIVTSVLIKMEEAGEDVKLLWNREKPKIKGISLFYEIGRIEDEELIEAVLRQLIKEMRIYPDKTVKEWEADLRRYRFKLKGIIKETVS